MNYDNIEKIDSDLSKVLQFVYNNTTNLDSSIKPKDFNKVYQNFINSVYTLWKCSQCEDITKKLMFTSLSYLNFMKLIPRPKRFKNLNIDIIYEFFDKMIDYRRMIGNLDFNNKTMEDIQKDISHIETALNNFNTYKKNSLENLFNQINGLSQEIAFQMSFDVNYLPHAEIDKLTMSNFVYCRMNFKDWIKLNEYDIDVYYFNYGEYSEYCECQK